MLKSEKTDAKWTTVYQKDDFNTVTELLATSVI